MSRKLWTKEEDEIMKQLFSNNKTEVLVKELHRSFESVRSRAFTLRLKKSETFKQSAESGRLMKGCTIGKNTWFKKGQIAFNKGKNQQEFMSAKAIQKSVATRFKKGQLPHNTIKEGDEVLRKDKSGRNYRMIKLPGERKLKYKHIHIWQQTNGKVPKGFNVIFKDLNSMNCVIENLECISNAENMLRNSINNYPAEISNTLKLIGSLRRRINKQKKQSDEK